MIEGIPWPTFSVAAGGWLLAFVCVLGLFRGTIVTRREVNAKDATIAAQAKTIEQQGEQLTLVLKESMPTVNSVLRALHQAAEDQQAGDRP